MFEYGLMFMYKCEVRNIWWIRIYLYLNKIMIIVYIGNNY